MSSNSEKCPCEDTESTQDSDSSNSASSSPKSPTKTAISLSSIFKRRGRSAKGKKAKKSLSYPGDGVNNMGPSSNAPSKNTTSSSGGGASVSGKKSPKWPLKLYSGKKKSKNVGDESSLCCKCTCYRRNEEVEPSFSEPAPVEKQEELVSKVEPTVPENNNEEETPEPRVDVQINEVAGNSRTLVVGRCTSFADFQWSRISLEDVEEEARIERAREIERGVDPPASFRPARRVQLLCADETDQASRRLQIVCPPDVTIDSLRALFQHVTLRSGPLDIIAGCHTQVDFIHCLVPDLLNITNCSFYWGKMDRYEAERLLDSKREGTFLLRDSAQEEFLFSVSFRKYGRSLHARIEQWNHKFSFDSHDPGVYTSNTVCGLIEHYKDPSSCMFFEPMLTWPLHRNFVFSLQHLCRATIVSKLSYDDVNQLQLPKSLKIYLKEYHYRQKVRVERFDDDVAWLDLRNAPA